MIRLALLAVFLAIPMLASAEFVGVYIPLCFTPQATPIEALRIKQDGWPTREIRPMWAAMGGRTNLFHYGYSDRALNIYTVKGGVETPLLWGKRGTVDEADCTATETVPAPTLGSFYGIREQTLRALQQLYTTNDPHPIDTDEDGTIRENDMLRIWDHVVGRFPDFTYNLCTRDDCP